MRARNIETKPVLPPSASEVFRRASRRSVPSFTDILHDYNSEQSMNRWEAEAKRRFNDGQ